VFRGLGIRKPDNQVIRKLFVLVTLSLVTQFLTSCVSLHDPETSQDFSTDLITTLQPGQAVGQTFVTRRPRLDGVTLWLESGDPDALISVELFHAVKDQNPIFATTIRVSEGTTTIPFPPQSNFPGQEYYLRLQARRGETQIFGRGTDNYARGSAFLADQPIEGDLAFRATYDYDWQAARSDLLGILGLWKVLLILGGLLIIPGWLLLNLYSHHSQFDPGEKIAYAIGLSMAIIPVVMLWTATLGLGWTKTSVQLGGGISLIILAIQVIKGQGAKDKTRVQDDHSPFVIRHSTFSLLLAIFAISLFVRFAMVRDLTAPAWVDSIHHSLITRGILESGGYPTENLPHSPVEANQYHPGYHSVLATFIWLSDLSVPEAMLIFGQVLNAVMIFGVYGLTKQFTKDEKTGLVAALVTGLFTLMPGYYASWGRYTQLAGLLILPVGFGMASNRVSGRNTVAKLILGGLTFAGIFIVHYRVLIFFLLLILAYWISQIYRPHNLTRKNLLKSIIFVGATGIIGMILALPWLIPTVNEFVLPRVNNWGLSKAVGPEFQGINWRYLTPALGTPAMILAGLGLIWGLFRRRRFSITMLVWGLSLYGIARPSPFGIRLLGFVNQTSVEIMLFIPISILGGYFISEVIASGEKIFPNKFKPFWQSIVLIIGVGSAILGAQRLLPTLNPVTFLYREADSAALTWIQENIPSNETIVINPTGWGYGLYMGNDGGFWISPLTDHQTMPPNVLYGMDRDQRGKINQFVEEILPIGEDAGQIWDLIYMNGYRYIYLGGRGGVISAQALAESDQFITRYHHENTWVFEAHP
jgi:hypothetical protein